MLAYALALFTGVAFGFVNFAAETYRHNVVVEKSLERIATENKRISSSFDTLQKTQDSIAALQSQTVWLLERMGKNLVRAGVIAPDLPRPESPKKGGEEYEDIPQIHYSFKNKKKPTP